MLVCHVVQYLGSMYIDRLPYLAACSRYLRNGSELFSLGYTYTDAVVLSEWHLIHCMMEIRRTFALEDRKKTACVPFWCLSCQVLVQEHTLAVEYEYNVLGDGTRTVSAIVDVNYAWGQSTWTECSASCAGGNNKPALFSFGIRLLGNRVVTLKLIVTASAKNPKTVDLATFYLLWKFEMGSNYVTGELQLMDWNTRHTWTIDAAALLISCIKSRCGCDKRNFQQRHDKPESELCVGHQSPRRGEWCHVTKWVI